MTTTLERSKRPRKIEYGTLKSYGIGFVLSVLLTLAAYFLVVKHVLTGWHLHIAVATLAVIQALIQLQLFLNLTREPKPRWNLVVFLFMLLVIGILVIGSLWIMHHLNYNLMMK